jgi:hypothetical protein
MDSISATASASHHRGRAIGQSRISTDHITDPSETRARQEGIEPPTYGLEGRCSIQLSYWRMQRSRLCRISYLVATPPAVRFFRRETLHETRDTLFNRGERI